MGVALVVASDRRGRTCTVILVSFFMVSQELFSRIGDYIGRPTHDRLVTLRQTGRIPREGIEGGGTTWPASFFISPLPDHPFTQTTCRSLWTISTINEFIAGRCSRKGNGWRRP